MARVERDGHAPEFTATDCNGNSFTLSSFIDRMNVLLVLNRGFS